MKAALPLSTALGNVIGTTVALTSGTGYLAGMSGIGGVDAVDFEGPYNTTKPGANAPTLEANVTVSGSAGTAAGTVSVSVSVSVSVQTVTGGAVTVNSNAVTPPTLPISTQSPGRGMTTCIAAVGLYPNHP